MIEWPLVLVGGLLGSAHCLGMCGPFAIAIGAGSPGIWANLQRQLSYSAGRIATYALAGAMAGALGLQLAAKLDTWVPLQALLSLLAGILLISQGLRSAGVWPGKRGAASTACLASGFFGPLLQGSGWQRTFLAGLMTGWLPCGLVYAMLGLAASSGSLSAGLLTMFLFGLGTVPLMVLTGCGATVLSYQRRVQVLRLAAWCLVLAGAVSCSRAAAFMTSSAPPAERCPACRASAVASAPDSASPWERPGGR